MLLKIGLTILIAWMTVGVVGLLVPPRQLRPNFYSGAAWFVCGLIVCYLWVT